MPPVDARRRVRVCPVEALGPGEVRVVDGPDGSPVLVANDGGELLAVDDTCPHAGGPLHEGSIDDGLVTCPLHAYSFDLRTGECLEDASLAVACHRLSVDGGSVWLEGHR